MKNIPRETVESFATELLARGGVGPEEAALVARSLVGANLRGHDSHGVMRVPYYLAELDKGTVFSDAEFTVLRDTPSILTADGHWGFGQRQAGTLTERLIAKASESGVAVGTLLRSSHIGRLGEYCETAADAGYVSMLMVNTHGNARRVAPPGGTAPRVGTNPIAFGVPAEPHALILDFGTSATAEGKVRVKRIAGEPCPEGWVLDADGQPTTDPAAIYADPPGTIRPMGGDQAYKGFGLAMIVEVFSGALSGGDCIAEVPTGYVGNCVFMMVVDPEAMGGRQHFQQQAGVFFDYVRSCPPVAGGDAVLLPGDPERNTMAARERDGIPFDDGNWQQLVECAERLGVEVPVV